MMLFYYKKDFDRPLDCPACAAGAPKKEIVAFRPDITKDKIIYVDADRLKRPSPAPDPEKKEK